MSIDASSSFSPLSLPCPNATASTYNSWARLQHRQTVESAIETLNLRERVTLYGYVTEEILSAMLDEADLAINLRYPTMGEASASQLRIWDHALPSLVTYSEGYTTLPPETVFFVHPENEAADIQEHLRHFLDRPDDFDQAGAQGRRSLLEHHLPSMYVTGLDDLIGQVDGLRSRHKSTPAGRPCRGRVGAMD